jgi:Predicted membrane protein
MRSLKYLSNGASAAVVSLGLIAGAAALTMTPAFAQFAALTTAQISAIQAALQNALASALTDEAREAAISNTTQSSISLYGGGAVASVTSTIMQSAEQKGVAICSIGRGLAQAAVNLTASNAAGANTIAATVANEGQTLERSCFQTAANEKGFANLASLAGQSPTVTGATGGTGGGVGLGATGGGATGGGVAGGGGGGCLNPSCTRF